jgi:hypothetical protein
MPQPVKLSDALVLDARLSAEVEQRSIAGQVEYWASLGKLVDAMLDGRTRTDALKKSGVKPLSELIESVGRAEGDVRLHTYLESEPYPHFEPHPTRKGMLIRTDARGKQSAGRFVDRKFVEEPADGSQSRRTAAIGKVHTGKFIAHNVAATGRASKPHPGASNRNRPR